VAVAVVCRGTTNVCCTMYIVVAVSSISISLVVLVHDGCTYNHAEEYLSWASSTFYTSLVLNNILIINF